MRGAFEAHLLLHVIDTAQHNQNILSIPPPFSKQPNLILKVNSLINMDTSSDSSSSGSGNGSNSVSLHHTSSIKASGVDVLEGIVDRYE